MSYVMVPVPEQHVQEVMRYVLKLLEEEELEGWDEESMRQFFGESDEITRAVLSYVAQPEHVRGVRKDEVARDLELQGYLPTVMKTLIFRSRKDYGRVPPVRKEMERSGRSGQREVPLLIMDEDVADFVRAAEQAVHRTELQDEQA